MQAAVPEAVDLSPETGDTQSLYGIDHATALRLLIADHNELVYRLKGCAERADFNGGIVY